MTKEQFKRACELETKLNNARAILSKLDRIDNETDVVGLHRVIMDSDITVNRKLKHLTYNYVKACREILKQDLEEAEREFTNL